MTAYTKVYNVEGSGQTLDRATLAAYKQTKTVYDVLGGTGTIRLTQGSYSTAVSQSGNTHAGSGAVDMMISIGSNENYRLLEKAARMCMFADWDRPPLYRDGKQVWGHHNHGILIGSKYASDSAKNQIRYYFADEDGLVSHNEDLGWKPRVLFKPRYPLRNVNLENVRAEAKKTSGRLPLPGIVRIQKALNKKLGTDLRLTGRWNAKTRAAYARWEKTVGGNADGVPAYRSLVLLGAGLFNVKK